MWLFLAKPGIVREPLTSYRLHEDQVCSLVLNIKRKRKKRGLKQAPYKIKKEAKRIIFRKKIAEMRLQEAIVLYRGDFLDRRKQTGDLPENPRKGFF